MTTPVDLVVDRLSSLDLQPRQRGDQWESRCPAHDDRSPSLGVATGADGRALVTCRAGCGLDDVLQALSLTKPDLFERTNGHQVNAHDEIVATYDYLDEAGNLVFQVIRRPGKQFRQRRPDGHGGWIWHLGPCQPKCDKCRRNDEGAVANPPLYRLPAVLAAVTAGEPLMVCEGEKDVHAAEAAGVIATTNPMGAGKWRPWHTAALAGADVVIVADRDKPGRPHARHVALDLERAGCTVRCAEPLHGKDLADHLAAGHTIEQLVLIEDRWAAQPPPRTDEVVDAASPVGLFVDWSAFWERDRTQAEWLYEPILARGRGHAVWAGHKTGKSLLFLAAAAQLATGLDAVAVIYLDYEMGEDDLYERLDDMGYGPGTDLTRLHYALLPSLPPLDSPAGAAEIERILNDVQSFHPAHHIAVFIDTMGRAVSGEENSADTIRAFYRHTGLLLKQRGTTWTRLDHAGKDTTRGQRGSSAKGDDVDVVWHLTRTETGVRLHRDLSRMSWIPEDVHLHRRDDPLRFVNIAGSWPAGTKEVAELLDTLGVPVTEGWRGAARALKAAQSGRRADVVRAAVRYRKQALEASGPTPGPTPRSTDGTHLPDPPQGITL